LATASTSRREGRLSSADGTHLYWRAWEVPEPKATFAVVHGLGEHSGRYERFAKGMAKRGFSTFAVDLRGMGKSQGTRGVLHSWSEWVQDAAALVASVQDHPSAGEVIPVGHSFGGVVLLSAVLRDAVMTPRFVLSSPALRTKLEVPRWKLAMGRLASRLAPTMTLSNEVDPATVSRDPAVVSAYRSDRLVHGRIGTRLYTEWLAACEEANRHAAEIAVPFLVILGQEDRLIDPEGARRLARLATAAEVTVKEYPGGYHEPFNDLDSERVFDDVALWAGRLPAS
jgi:acylglycerol lipase